MSAPDRDERGYRITPGPGPRLRSDVIDVYVFRRAGRARGQVEFLQLLRAKPPLDKTWHPVMGHVEDGESAVDCAWREMEEELGLARGDEALLGVWALEQVHPFFIAEIDSIVLSPRFAAEVARDWEPRLDADHSAHRWVARERIGDHFMWPGQVASIREITETLLPERSLSRDRLRLR